MAFFERFLCLGALACAAVATRAEQPVVGETAVRAQVVALPAEVVTVPAQVPEKAARNPRDAPGGAPGELTRWTAAAEDAAAATAAAALAAARKPDPWAEAAPGSARPGQVLPTEGRPGDVRLVAMTTSLPVRRRGVVPPLPIPPFRQWNRWLEEHKQAAHCALDWMDAQGRWWHTELRAYDHFAAQYRVGTGEFQCTGLTVYGVFLMPGRTDPEDQQVLHDEKIACDYRVLEAEARAYGRKDRCSGDPGTGGNGSRNVGLGGPAFKPSQNSNTYISYLLRRAGVRHPAPEGAVGWDTVPRFPYSSDAQE